VRVEICFRGVSPSRELAHLIRSACAQVEAGLTGDCGWRFDLDRDRVACCVKIQLEIDGESLTSQAHSSDSVIACWRALTVLYDELVRTRNPMRSLRPSFGPTPRRVLPRSSGNSQSA